MTSGKTLFSNKVTITNTGVNIYFRGTQFNYNRPKDIVLVLRKPAIYSTWKRDKQTIMNE